MLAFSLPGVTKSADGVELPRDKIGKKNVENKKEHSSQPQSEPLLYRVISAPLSLQLSSWRGHIFQEFMSVLHTLCTENYTWNIYLYKTQ